MLTLPLAVLRGDHAEQQRALAAAAGKPGAEDLLADGEAFAQLFAGHPKEAREKTRRAAETAQRAGRKERAALFRVEAAVRDAFLGNLPEAKQSATAALELSQGRDVQYGAALALALGGETSVPARIANLLEKKFTEDTSVRYSYVPEIRALVALNQGEPAKALETLKIAAPYETGWPNSVNVGSFGALYPIYVRGRVYLKAGEAVKAAAEFQNILDHAGVACFDPLIRVAARVGLGQAYEMAGDRSAREKSAFEEVVAFWKDADQDILFVERGSGGVGGSCSWWQVCYWPRMNTN